MACIGVRICPHSVIHDPKKRGKAREKKEKRMSLLVIPSNFRLEKGREGRGTCTRDAHARTQNIEQKGYARAERQEVDTSVKIQVMAATVFDSVPKRKRRRREEEKANIASTGVRIL
jgi:hypothetical protein